ncbi:MAG: Na+/H+ antiporter subunit D [Syntrophomonas sp.]|nr:Na+/H+ antiporter subunit D [Syntrophomonas sp.]
MNNIVILPLLIPLVAGLLMGIARGNIPLQRWLSVLSCLFAGAASLLLVKQVFEQGIQTLAMGGWPAPFGIVLVADMLSSLLLVTTSIVSLACLLFAFRTIGSEREQYYFYPLVQFLITGVNGSFLTGDLFNLYVCFEVMLVASYVLLTLGGTRSQLTEGIKYMVINVFASSLFLIAIGYLYAVVGTLNMAHLSIRIAEIGQTGFTTWVAVLLIMVFGLKAALFLHFWLPGSYSAPPAAIAAIFAALLTKVGIYAILRLFSLVFYHQLGITHGLLAVMAALTMIVGGIGAVAYWDIRKVLAYNVIIGVGFVVFGFSLFTPAALTGAIYYLIHDMLMKALLFLLGGCVIWITGSGKIREISGLISNHPLLGWLFFVTVLALTGIPPLSGFAGKYIIIRASLAGGTDQPGGYFLAAIGLLCSLMIMYSLLRIFLHSFWGENTLSLDMEKGSIRGLLSPCLLLMAVGVFYGVGAELVYPYIEQAAVSMLDPDLYIRAVLPEVI